MPATSIPAKSYIRSIIDAIEVDDRTDHPHSIFRAAGDLDDRETESLPLLCCRASAGIGHLLVDNPGPNTRRSRAAKHRAYLMIIQPHVSRISPELLPPSALVSLNRDHPYDGTNDFAPSIFLL